MGAPSIDLRTTEGVQAGGDVIADFFDSTVPGALFHPGPVDAGLCAVAALFSGRTSLSCVSIAYHHSYRACVEFRDPARRFRGTCLAALLACSLFRHSGSQLGRPTYQFASAFHKEFESALSFCF
jgi:hypothetical protein